MGRSVARSRGDTGQRNTARLLPGCQLPIDQRRLTDGDYELRAVAAVVQFASIPIPF